MDAVISRKARRGEPEFDLCGSIEESGGRNRTLIEGRAAQYDSKRDYGARFEVRVCLSWHSPLLSLLLLLLPSSFPCPALLCYTRRKAPSHSGSTAPLNAILVWWLLTLLHITFKHGPKV